MSRPTEQDIIEIYIELLKLLLFIAKYGDKSDLESKDVLFDMNVSDALNLVLGEISTDRFRSDAYLCLDCLRRTASIIEKRTGQKLQDYK